MTLETAVVGGVGSDHHLSGLQECPDTELVAICDLDESRASEKATEYDIDAYADFEGMLARESLDWIHLCTPVGTHLELARMAIEDGIPVLIAKPVTESLAEAEELERLVEEYDATVSVDHTHNFSPAMRKARRRIEDGTIGELRSVDLQYAGETYPDEVRQGSWPFEFPGGGFGAELPHPIYMLLHLGGYPSGPGSIQASTSLSNDYPQEFEYDSVQFQYTTDDGVLCSATVLAGDVPHRIIQIHGDRGSIEVDIVSQSVTVLDRDYQNSAKTRALTNMDRLLSRLWATTENLVAIARHTVGDRGSVGELDSHGYQFAEEARAIKEGEPTAVPVTEGTWTLHIMETIRASATNPDEIQTISLRTDST